MMGKVRNVDLHTYFHLISYFSNASLNFSTKAVRIQIKTALNFNSRSIYFSYDTLVIYF